MKIARALASLTLGFLLGVVIAAQGTAVGHNAATWYGIPWGSDGLPSITYKFNDNFPTGNWRDRVRDAADRWSNVDPNNFAFNNLSSDNPKNFGNQCADYDFEENVIYYRNLSGAYGLASVCAKSNGNAKWFTVSFDSSQNWYRGTGNPASNEIDAWSVAQQELGHGTGFLAGSGGDHFSSDSDCDRDAPIDLDSWQTMCAGTVQILGYDEEKGHTFRRTLETHDKHTLDNQY